MPVLEGFRTLAGIGDDEQGIGIGQCQGKESDLDQLPGHFHQGETEVHLGFSRLMHQGNEDFSTALFELPNRLFDLGVAPAVTLFAQPLEDPFRRMSLFAGQFLIGFEDSGDPFQVRTDLGLVTDRRLKLRWGRMRQDLFDGFEVKSGLSLDLTDTHSVSKHSLSYLTPFFHVPKHSLLPPVIPQGPIP